MLQITYIKEQLFIKTVLCNLFKHSFLYRLFQHVSGNHVIMLFEIRIFKGKRHFITNKHQPIKLQITFYKSEV
jgi:hypothetical protein